MFESCFPVNVFVLSLVDFKLYKTFKHLTLSYTFKLCSLFLPNQATKLCSSFSLKPQTKQPSFVLLSLLNRKRNNQALLPSKLCYQTQTTNHLPVYNPLRDYQPKPHIIFLPNHIFSFLPNHIPSHNQTKSHSLS